MRLPPAHSLEARPSPATMMRLVTVLLVLMLGILAMVAAHHAQTAQGEASHAVLEYDTTSQLLAGNGGSSDIAGEHVVAGLATGCIVLIACCALGLALAARVWRADVFRQLSSVAKPLRANIGASLTALTSAARPNLIALSISRT